MDSEQAAVIVIPITRTEMCNFIREHHRHHCPPVGFKAAIAAAKDGTVVGVGIVGRPVARHLDDGWTCEITRVAVVDGEDGRNACSFLYGALRRLGFALGYRRIITYTLPTESGASLRGAGYRQVGLRGGGSWSTPTRPRVDKAPTCQKLLWDAVAP